MTTALQRRKGQVLRIQKTVVSPRPAPRSLLTLAGMYLVLDKELSYFPIHEGPKESLRLSWSSTSKAVETDIVEQLGEEPRRLLGV